MQTPVFVQKCYSLAAQYLILSTSQITKQVKAQLSVHKTVASSIFETQSWKRTQAQALS
ncbi:hypothetical protein [Gloeocapsopsis crepidinum]|uniref:hypothetical protein n=1 Tax=Gloeocapsopsis crepidinum TaxID=693223 RepID=UPI001D1586FC|nr:hypothetical protein [Gloeocapsopsis crepidinum]